MEHQTELLYNRDTEAALLKWVNTFPLDTPVQAVSELCDGMVFCKMLEDLDPELKIKDLEKNAGGSSKWLRQKIRLEAVYKSLLRYYRNHIDEDMEYLTRQTIDFDKIAEQDDAQQTLKLLVIFLMATLNTKDEAKRVAYIVRITASMDETSQVQIMKIKEEMDKLQKYQALLEDPVALPGNLGRDFDLALEEQTAALIVQRDNLKKKCADQITALDNFRESQAALQEQNRVLEKKLALRDTNNSEETINRQNQEISELENIIEQHEGTLNDKRIQEGMMQKELNDLRRTAEKLTGLDDEVRSLRAENEALTKKANMVDHYKKKLEGTQDYRLQFEKLKEQCTTLEFLTADYDDVKGKNQALENSMIEYRTMFSKYEREMLDNKRIIGHLRSNLQAGAEETSRLQNIISHDEVAIKELQKQLEGVGDSPASPTTSDRGQGGQLSLEDELEQTSDTPRPNLRLENSRLKAENSLLKTGPSNAILQNQLEALNKEYQRVVENAQASIEENALLHEQILVLLDSATSDKDLSLRQTREAFNQANDDLTAARKTIAEQDAQLSKCRRELLEAKTDLEAVQSDDIEQLKMLKETHNTNLSSIEEQLKLLQGKNEALETDFQQQQKHLIQTLLAKDKLAKQLVEAPNSGNEQSALESLKEASAKQQSVIEDLQKRLRAAEQDGVGAQKSAQEELVKNLTRENSLMASAWYDLTSRLQSNHVVLQRRQDAPKSWLNKQRQMVNTTPRR